MLFLSKVLPVFIYPLGLAILLCAIALVFANFRKLTRTAVAASVVILWVSSMPALANWLSAAWEAGYPPVAAEKLPQADAVVLLGGIVGQPVPPRIEPDLSDSVDRVFEAARLFQAGKAPRIVVSGGNLPWQTVVVPESTLIAGLLADLGVPRGAIVLETGSRNTHENAVNTAAIFHDNGWQAALLVTSGHHMRRAIASFARAGIDVTAAAADIHGRDPPYESLLDFLPDAGALALTTSVITEMIGLLYYRARGWA